MTSPWSASSVTSADDAAVRSAVSAIRQVTEAPVLLGGRGVVDGAAARRLGADSWAPDPRARRG